MLDTGYVIQNFENILHLGPDLTCRGLAESLKCKTEMRLQSTRGKLVFVLSLQVSVPVQRDGRETPLGGWGASPERDQERRCQDPYAY